MNRYTRVEEKGHRYTGENKGIRFLIALIVDFLSNAHSFKITILS